MKTSNYIFSKCNQHNGETTIVNFIVTLKLCTVDLHKITVLLYFNGWAQAGRMDQMVGLWATFLFGGQGWA